MRWRGKQQENRSHSAGSRKWFGGRFASMDSRVRQPEVTSCPLWCGAPYLAPDCQGYVAWGRLLNISVQTGSETYLPCNLGETVSDTETKFSKAPEVHIGLLLLDHHCPSSFNLVTFLWISSIQLGWKKYRNALKWEITGHQP